MGSVVGAKSASFRSGVCDAIRPFNFAILPLDLQIVHSIFNLLTRLTIRPFNFSILPLDLQFVHSICNSPPQFFNSLIRFYKLLTRLTICPFDFAILPLDLQIVHSICSSRTKNKPFRTVPILMINVQ